MCHSETCYICSGMLFSHLGSVFTGLLTLAFIIRALYLVLEYKTFPDREKYLCYKSKMSQIYAFISAALFLFSLFFSGLLVSFLVIGGTFVYLFYLLLKTLLVPWEITLPKVSEVFKNMPKISVTINKNSDEGIE